MKLITIVAIISLLGIAWSATCGTGPAVSSFEADVISKIENFAGLKPEWDQWKASSAVDIAQGKAPKACETLFAGKKTCCTQATLNSFKNIYQTYIQQFTNVGQSFFGFGPKKGMQGDKLSSDITNVMLKCAADYLAKHPELNKTTSASASVSMSMSGSPVIPDSLQKIMKAMENTKKRADGLMKKTIAELGLMSLRLFRGTQCALCMDPDAILTTIWDGGVLVKEADVTGIKDKVKKGIADSIEGAKEKHKYTTANYQARLEMYECQAGLDLLKNFNAENEFCKDDAGCTKAADAAVTSAWVVKSDALTVENPKSLRVLQAASLKPSATAALAAQTEDATEDADVKVGGQSVTELQTEATAAETELKAEPLDVNAAIAATGGTTDSSVMMFALSLFIVIAGLIL